MGSHFDLMDEPVNALVGKNLWARIEVNRKTNRPNWLAQGPKKGLTDARSAVGFCLGSGLFGSYNSD
jgi:hypothetical protein